jgi:hypothetical protein
VEGGERPGPLEVVLDVIILLVQAPYDLVNKGTVLHVLAEITEVVCHLVLPVTVVVDAQITLYEELKLCVEVEGVHLRVAEELLLKGNPKLLSGTIVAAVAGTSGLMEVGGDGAEQPRQHHAVRPTPVGFVEGRSVRGDMVIKGVALERRQHKVTPMRVLGGRDSEDDGH